MPFITEEIWQMLPGIEGESIMTAPYPQAEEEWLSKETERLAEVFKAVVVGARSIKAALGVPLGRKVDLFLKPPDDEREKFLRESAEAIAFLARTNPPQISQKIERPVNTAFSVEKGVEVYLSLEGLVDLEEQKRKLKKELEKTGKTLKQLESKLKNSGFLNKASPEVVEKVKLRYSEELETRERLEKLLEQLG
jgi:valyl-tRNA synthetase